MIKRMLPRRFRILVRQVIKLFKYRYRRVAISWPVSRAERIKIIVGAAETHQKGWYSTNEQWLDITVSDDWQRVFKGKRIITHVVAEHVFEHLTYQECQQALANIRSYLVDGGGVRIAVPDGFHPDVNYLRHVGINGIGDDAGDHKQLLNVDVLFQLFRETGYKPTHLEGYNRDGVLVQHTYSPDDGYIRRCRSNAVSKDRTGWDFIDADTSLIVDGMKA